MSIVADQRATHRSRRPRGLPRQRRARWGGGPGRWSAGVFARWLDRFDARRSATARRLGLSPAALTRWTRRWREDQMALTPRGRPVEDLDRETRHGILSMFSLLGPHATL